jgi:RND family efflux transporter MFP subunit
MKKALAFLLFLISAGISWYCYTSGILHRGSPQSASPAALEKSVRVVPVKDQKSGLVFPLVGRVFASKSVEITPEVTARISKVHVSSAQAVKKGQLLIELDHGMEEAKLREETVRLDNQLRRLSMMQKLNSKGVVSLDSMEQLRAETEQQKAVVEARKAALEERKIYAPFSGVLSMHRLTPGELVKPGNVLLQLDDLSEVYVDFNIPERLMSQLVPGQKVTGTAEAWPNEKFNGVVREIDTHVKSDTLAIKIRVFFKNDNVRLLDGMMMEIELSLFGGRYAVIPLKSIWYQGDDRYVFILNKDGTVSRRRIVLGPVTGSFAAVLDGIRPGMQVVSEGIEKLSDGDRVRVLSDEKTLEELSDDVPLRKKNRTGDAVL